MKSSKRSKKNEKNIKVSFGEIFRVVEKLATTRSSYQKEFRSAILIDFLRLNICNFVDFGEQRLNSILNYLDRYVRC